MRLEIVPAILAKSEEEFREKLQLIEDAAPLVQIDVMDGEFVPNRTWADPLVIAHIKTPVEFEVHLMVKEPFREVIMWGKLKNVRRTIVHAESTTKLRELLHTIRATGKEVGLAVNPGTKLKDVLPYLSPNPLKLPLPAGGGEKNNFPPSHRERLSPFLKGGAGGGARADAQGGRGRVVVAPVDFLLVMANDPGFSGRPFKRATLKEIAAVRKRSPELHIGVDIGVDVETAPLLRLAGATHIAAANSIFGAKDPVQAYRELKKAFLS